MPLPEELRLQLLFSENGIFSVIIPFKEESFLAIIKSMDYIAGNYAR
jgi:hypothetical protein